MKPKAKKVLKIISPILGIGIGITTVVLTSGIMFKIATVSIGGSTAVLPLVNDIANQLNYIDIVTSAGGSGVGISSIIDGSKEIGMASKNPKFQDWKNTDAHKYQVWKDRSVKTLTIAWDGIGIIYKPPVGNTNSIIDINKETLGMIYNAFSGYQEITFGQLLNNNDSTTITPYARNGGGDVSGTTEAFLIDNHLDYQSSNYWTKLNQEAQKTITTNIQKGSYGKNVKQTSEANSQAWANVKNGPIGSMIYLSAGFILNNLEEIKKHGFEVASYQGTPLNYENIAQGYNWFRPFNLIYSIKYIKNKPEIIQMLIDILFDQNKIHTIMQKNGFKPLSELQISSMFKNIDVGQAIDKKVLFTDEGYSDVELGHSGAKAESWK